MFGDGERERERELELFVEVLADPENNFAFSLEKFALKKSANNLRAYQKYS